MTIASLGALVGPQNEAAFRASFADKKLWHAKMDLRPQIADLLPWSTLDMLVGGAAIPTDKIRVLIDSNEVLRSLYADEKGRLRPSAIQQFANQGATLSINDIGQFVPQIGALTAMVERTLRCRTGANTYISFGKKSAFLAHHDGHDVLILQIHGSKHWRAYGASQAFPISSGHTGSPPDCQWEGVMTPGDILYLPRGEIHAAVPDTTPSVHLTISILEDTGVDFVRWLADRAESVVALRRDLGATLSGQARATRDCELAEALRALLNGTTVAEFTAERDRERNLRSVVTLGGASRIHSSTRLVSALRRPVDLALENDGRVLVEFGQRQFRLTLEERQVLGLIIKNGVISVSALRDALAHEGGMQALHGSITTLLENTLVSILE